MFNFCIILRSIAFVNSRRREDYNPVIAFYRSLWHGQGRMTSSLSIFLVISILWSSALLTFCR